MHPFPSDHIPSPIPFCRTTYSRDTIIISIKLIYILLLLYKYRSLQHFAYLTGWVPHIRDLELIRLSFTIWSGHFKRYGPYEYRLSEVPWIRIRQNFLLREYMAPGWAELLAENMLAGKNVEDGSYRVHAELLLPNRTSLLCMVADLVIRDGTMEF
ncbi:hypothetical protein D8B26_000523 [Coccidioides posadasii str. Silveira]|uniref:uncharacterized protein n=1 Tax=Coccidioides posadasii (strain RMSCC 757 / Silveira) TaxID=443226 RepID=UPI001BEDC834|nr:hypothetical protein D8B26_000523 [Coccidioides posadasii str. Silveira]